MKRSHFRNLWLLVMIILLISAWLLFQKAESERKKIDRANANLVQLKRERRNIETLAADLATLDKLTIDQKTATRLGILRHLDFEDTNYDFRLGTTQNTEVNGAKLYARGFEVRAILPYQEALQLIDTLHANRKVVLSDYVLEAIRRGEGIYGDKVKMTVKGSLYGLDKQS